MKTGFVHSESPRRRLAISSLVIAVIAFAVPAQAQRRLFAASDLIKFADYPPVAVAKRQQGNGSILINIAEDGSVSKCRLHYWNGNKSLGRTTCALISQRAKYIPARDAAGKPVPGEDYVSVEWLLPPQYTLAGNVDYGGSVPVDSGQPWVGPDDIDVKDMGPSRNRAVAIAFRISPEGRVGQCSVLIQSGSPKFDKLACDLFKARARFKTPLDENGQHYATIGKTIIRWRLGGSLDNF